MPNIAAILCIAAILSACATPPKPAPPRIISPFDRADHERFVKPGKAQIRGQAFLRQRGGGTVTCAGNHVVLMPATTYFREYMSASRAGGKPTQAAGVSDVIRVAQCDAQGNFAFATLPAERWLIATEVVWRVRSIQGGTLAAEVETKDGLVTNVILSDNEFYGR